MSSCFLLLVLASASLADQVKVQPFKPGFPSYYVQAAGEDKDVPKIDVHEQKELVTLDGGAVKGTQVVAADVAPEKIDHEVKVTEDDKHDDPPKEEEDVGKEAVEEGKEGPVPHIPDGTKDPEMKKEEDDLPKDGDYKPEVNPDEKMGGEIPEEPFMPTGEEVPAMEGFPLVPPNADKEVTLYELCQRLGLRRFLFLMHRAGLRNLLFRPGSFRLFVPTDEAFGRLPYGMKVRLMRDPPFLRRVLLYHIMDGSIPMGHGYTKTKSPGMAIHVNNYGGVCTNNRFSLST